MVVRAKDELELDELIKIASKGITEEELEDVVSEYKVEANRQITRHSFEARKEEYKREKSKAGFERGDGGFKRST